MPKDTPFKTLPETELEHAAQHLVGDSRSGYHTGLYVLILEHIGSLVAEQRYADVETTINTITATMIREECPRKYAQEQGEKLRDNTRRSLTESLAECEADRS